MLRNPTTKSPTHVDRHRTNKAHLYLAYLALHLLNTHNHVRGIEARKTKWHLFTLREKKLRSLKSSKRGGYLDM